MDMNQQGAPSRPAKKKGRFTAVDTVILLLVLVTVFGTVFGWVYRMVKEDDDRADNRTFAVSFRVEKTHRLVAEGLQVNEKIYLVDTDRFLGYLQKPLEVTPDQASPYPDRVSATGVMICVGDDENQGLRVERDARYLTPGATLQVRTEREILTIYIVDIVEVTARG